MAKLEFDNSAKGLSLLNALFFVTAAGLVSENLNQIDMQLRDNCGFSKYKPFDNQDTQAFIAANDEIIVLSFRGTTSMRDWRTDLNIKLVFSKVGRIHRGFNEALDYIWQELRQALIDFRDKEQSIWITGHSLGGALATLAVDRLTEESIEIKGLYTFGQPKVGDKVFARNFDNKMKKLSFRFVHDEDIVPKVPTLFQGYHHIGTECYFDRDNKMYTENIGWYKFISRCTSVAIRSSEKASEFRAQNPGSFSDHSVSYYKRCIQENLIKEKGGPHTFNEYINN